MFEPSRSALIAHVQAWSEQSADAAKALLASCWTEDSEVIGPGFYFKGVAAVLAEIDRFHREQPGYKAIATSDFDTHGRWTRFTIAMIAPDGTKAREGWDIIEHADDGSIRRVITFWGRLPVSEQAPVTPSP